MSTGTPRLVRSTQIWNKPGIGLLFVVFLRQHPIQTTQVASSVRHVISVFCAMSRCDDGTWQI